MCHPPQPAPIYLAWWKEVRSPPSQKQNGNWLGVESSGAYLRESLREKVVVPVVMMRDPTWTNKLKVQYATL